LYLRIFFFYYKENQLSELSTEKDNLNREVNRREISAIEIERSQAQRDQLLSQQKSVDLQLEGKRKIMGEYEVNLRKIIDEVNDTKLYININIKQLWNYI